MERQRRFVTQIDKNDPLYRRHRETAYGSAILWNSTVAIKRESERIVRELLKMGVDVPTVNNGHEPLDRDGSD